MDRAQFYKEVYSIIKEIPYGNVSTYGKIAQLIGKPQCSRMVGQALSHAPVYGHSINMPDYVAEFLDLAKHCSELAENAETAKNEILEVIDSIENHTYRRILRMKYLDGKTFYEIGSDIGYNASYTRRLASQAIKEVTQSNIYLSYNGIQKN